MGLYLSVGTHFLNSNGGASGADSEAFLLRHRQLVGAVYNHPHSLHRDQVTTLHVQSQTQTMLEGNIWTSQEQCRLWIVSWAPLIWHYIWFDITTYNIPVVIRLSLSFVDSFRSFFFFFLFPLQLWNSWTTVIMYEVLASWPAAFVALFSTKSWTCAKFLPFDVSMDKHHFQ